MDIDTKTCPYCGGSDTRPDGRMPRLFECLSCNRLWKEDGRISVDVSRIRALEEEARLLRQAIDHMRESAKHPF